MAALRHVQGWCRVWFVAWIVIAANSWVGRDACATQEAAVAAVKSEASWEQVSEYWRVLELMDAPAGWTHERVEFDGERYRSTTEMSMSIKRGPASVDVSMFSEWMETTKGEPLQIRVEQNMSSQKTVTIMIFHPDYIEHISQQGGRELKKKLDLPEQKFLTPRAIHRLWKERLQAGADEVKYWMVTGESGATAVAVKHSRLRADEYEFDGRMYPVSVWSTTTSQLPGLTATTWVSADGRSMKEEVPAPFGRMVTRIATKEQARGVLKGGGPELMFNTFAAPDKPIANARKATRSVLNLRTRAGEMPDLPIAGAQRVERGADGRSVTLHVDIINNQPASEADAANKEFLEPSGAIDSSDKMILALTKRATEGVSREPMKRAEAIRKFVHEYITEKSLDTAFATASEVARMKAGDCSEHGVLLCAMLRADGIPARIAGGLVYADQFAGSENIFGWHMWTQALIDGRWVDFDATLPVRYDAVHVLTTVDSMAVSSLSDAMSTMIQLIGNLEIEVVEVEYGSAKSD